MFKDCERESIPRKKFFGAHISYRLSSSRDKNFRIKKNNVSQFLMMNSQGALPRTIKLVL